MRRGPGRTWPKKIEEVAAARPDPRAVDPQATQKITRAQLDEALKRTTSGTRLAASSEPLVSDDTLMGPRDSLAGPLDDSDAMFVVGIDADRPQPALVVPDSTTNTGRHDALSPASPLLDVAHVRARSGTPAAPSPDAPPARGFLLTARGARLVVVAACVLVFLAVAVGFVAGRIVH